MLVTGYRKEISCEHNSLGDIIIVYMGTVAIIIISVIIGFAILGFLFSPTGEKEEGAKTGAAYGCSFI